jgi:hypothetical protein
LAKPSWSKKSDVSWCQNALSQGDSISDNRHRHRSKPPEVVRVVFHVKLELVVELPQAVFEPYVFDTVPLKSPPPTTSHSSKRCSRLPSLHSSHCYTTNTLESGSSARTVSNCPSWSNTAGLVFQVARCEFAAGALRVPRGVSWNFPRNSSLGSRARRISG